MSDTQDTTQQDNTPQQPSPPDTSQGKPEGNEGTFTQADIDRISTRVRHEARDSERKKMLEELGIENFDSLKSMLADYTQRKQADMSELEKAQSQIQKANDEAEKARQEAETIRNQMITNGRKSVFMDTIRTHGGSDADNLYILVQASLSDEFGAVFEDGQTNPDDKALTAFVKTVQSKYPKYFGNAGAGNPSMAGGQNPSAGQQTQENMQAMTRKFRKL